MPADTPKPKLPAKQPVNDRGVHPAAERFRRGSVLTSDLRWQRSYPDLERVVLDLPVDDLRAVVLFQIADFQQQAKGPDDYAAWWREPESCQ
jgi:hypothetical protein